MFGIVLPKMPFSPINLNEPTKEGRRKKNNCVSETFLFIRNYAYFSLC